MFSRRLLSFLFSLFSALLLWSLCENPFSYLFFLIVFLLFFSVYNLMKLAVLKLYDENNFLVAFMLMLFRQLQNLFFVNEALKRDFYMMRLMLVFITFNDSTPSGGHQNDWAADWGHQQRRLWCIYVSKVVEINENNGGKLDGKWKKRLRNLWIFLFCLKI